MLSRYASDVPATVNEIVGFHGFQPPRPGQEEDILSESNVKNGIVIPAASVSEPFARGPFRVGNVGLRVTLNVVQAETWSAKDMIASAFREGVVSELENMFSLVFSHRNECVPHVP